MKKIYEKIIVVLIIVIAVFVGISAFKNNTITVNPPDINVEQPLGISIIPLTTIVDEVVANIASVSSDTGDDTFIYEAEPTASLSVGDIVRFKGGNMTELVADYPYFVVTASTSTSFEIASTSGGTVINLAASASGGEFASELPNSTVIDVSEVKYTTVTVDCSGSTVSASVNFAGSISDAQPNFYYPQANDNRWDYVYVNDIENSTGIAGDTGLNLTSADHREFKLYPETLKYLTVRFQDFEAGTCSIKLRSSE